jgi:hypothetical protein
VQIAQALPQKAWRRLSAGIGAKGERLYDWVLTPLWRLQYRSLLISQFLEAYDQQHLALIGAVLRFT